MQLIIAGKTDPVDKDFLNKNVFPFIDNKKIIYLGEVLGNKKKILLQKAHCLIQPNRFFEAFGNSFLEAMASGVPVISFDQGAVSELVIKGKTGYLVNNFSQMVEAVKKIKNINKQDCIDQVKNNFSLNKMIDSYEKLYYKIINNKK